jgi:hypothetical protein
MFVFGYFYMSNSIIVIENFVFGVILLAAGITIILRVNTEGSVELMNNSDLLLKLLLQVMMMCLKYFIWFVYSFMGTS